MYVIYIAQRSQQEFIILNDFFKLKEFFIIMKLHIVVIYKHEIKNKKKG